MFKKLEFNNFNKALALYEQNIKNGIKTSLYVDSNKIIVEYYEQTEKLLQKV